MFLLKLYILDIELCYYNYFHHQSWLPRSKLGFMKKRFRVLNSEMNGCPELWMFDRSLQILYNIEFCSG